ncbi:MAG: hypothetical protein U5J64_04140 [Halobacteriales archaeon]|nr:hypothetical protein [Halobacteriales archaeon]
MERHTRRGFVAGAAFVVSGCLSANDGEDTDDSTNDEDGTGEGDADDGTDGDTGETTEEAETDDDTDDEAEAEDGKTDSTTDDETDDDTDDDELDLREANVTGVSFSETGDGHRFDVTLYHDDDGEDGYADWWQVKSLDGERLGRRVLAHPHGTRRFTRSETVETGDETCVVVRGHDQTHGYGGRAVVVNVETGETNGVLQGEEPSSFDESDCP